MKRRRFVQKLLAAPAIPLVAAAAQEAPKPPLAPPPGNPTAQRTPQQGQAAPRLDTVAADVACEPDRSYFTPEQFAALEKLGDILVPPLKGRPGARDAHAPEFLDFLLSVSPADRQGLYRHGLNGLNAEAKKKFHRLFSELDSQEADEILRPLFVARPWDQDYPADPVKKFVAQVHEDLRSATMNSREWAESLAGDRQRGRGFGRGAAYYWKPIDPVVRS